MEKSRLENVIATEIVSSNPESGYNYSVIFGFERNFDKQEATLWMASNWKISFTYSAIYLIVIFGGRRYMKDRPRLEIRPVLSAWNFVLAAFSIMGALRTWPELLYTLFNHGFHHSVCIPSFYDGVTGFWAYMFVISKLPELGDTLFIVLRKQQLIFLHWYHHITVFIYVWYSYAGHTAPGRWFMVMNYTVHALMYTYYAFRALQFRIPKWTMMTITGLQLLQMIVGCGITIFAYKVKTRGEFCNQTWDNVHYCALMYASYFFLFAHFFYSTYLLDRKAKAVPAAPVSEKVDGKSQ